MSLDEVLNERSGERLTELVYEAEQSYPNIFEIIEKSEDERSHPRFLRWLLDPNGDHRAGTAFIESFINCYGPNEDVEDDINSTDEVRG
jgi:hypothetical protein